MSYCLFSSHAFEEQACGKKRRSADQSRPQRGVDRRNNLGQLSRKTTPRAIAPNSIRWHDQTCRPKIVLGDRGWSNCGAKPPGKGADPSAPESGRIGKREMPRHRCWPKINPNERGAIPSAGRARFRPPANNCLPTAQLAPPRTLVDGGSCKAVLPSMLRAAIQRIAGTEIHDS